MPRAALAGLLAAAGVAAAQASPSAVDTALAQMRLGKLAEARECAARAFQSEPSSPAARLTYAVLARDEAEAVNLLSALAGDTAAPDSLRAAAADRLGGLALVKRDYAAASAHYARACSLSNTAPGCMRHFHAALAGGDCRAAADAAAGMARTDSAAALYCRGLLAEEQRDMPGAYVSYKAAVQRLGSGSPLFLPALAGCALAADRLGYVTLAAQHRTDLERACRNPLERSLFARGFIPIAPAMPAASSAAPAAAERNDAPADGDRFTLQVGSFSAPANAQRLEQRLEEEFDDVRVEQVRLGDATHYRVRVGSFSDRDSAEQFGRTRISALGISYKVLKE